MQTHFFLQGKGGTGKSTTAILLAQYFLDYGSKVLCIDTDPVNRSLSLYPRLAPRVIDLMENSRINSLNYNQILSEIVSSDADHVLVDNGASSFVSFSNYLLENCCTEYLERKMNCGVNFHTVMVGGRAYAETLAGVMEICNSFPESARIHVWVNPYFGKVCNPNGIPFEETNAYKSISGRISSLVYLPDLNPETQGHEVAEMMRRGQTFAEAYEDEAIPAFIRFQLDIARERIYQSLEVMKF